MVFASATGPTVSKVFEMGRNFSGHLAQAAHDFIEPGISHYVVISDDLILNPRLNRDNLIAELGLGPDTGYIKGLCPSDALRFRWPWSGEAAASLRKYGKLFDWCLELPPTYQARAKFERMGLRCELARPRSLAALRFSLLDLPRESGWAFVMGAGMLGKPADYPLLSSHSDFLVMPASAIERFTHYCGVFAALNVFAEEAVPTALALACEEVRTELMPGEHFIDSDARCRSGTR